jgi:glycosyltransferase involved in cell wall biosynthesis
MEEDRVADPVWEVPGITEVTESDVPIDVFESFVGDNAIEVLFTDNLYQFVELAQLRRGGVKTVARFVWEHFAEEHVAGAREANDVVYSLTRAEGQRYRDLGLGETPYIVWGCHPEYIDAASGLERPDDGLVRLMIPGSFMGKRKPLVEMLEAFSSVRNDSLRLLVKGQVEKRTGMLEKAAAADPRIEILLADQPTAEHLRTVASFDVCLTPTRWEGLGLPLFEALSFGQPVITNDHPPMNEVIADGHNGLLVRSTPNGTARSGIPSVDPDVGELAAAIERIADPDLRRRLASGAVETRHGERAWSRTVEGFGELLESLS